MSKDERQTSSRPGQYLRDELYSRVRTDDSIFEFLQAGSLDGIWYWDLENPEYEWMSPAFWRLFGVDPDTRTHRASEWQDLIHPDDLAVAIENFQKHCADPDHPYDQIVRYRHADGSTVWVRCRGMAIRNASGEPIRMLGAHSDVTALKRTEEILSASKDEGGEDVHGVAALAEEVARQKRALEAAYDSMRVAREHAERASNLKSEFLNMVSHELRTPLTSLSLQTERIARVSEALPPKQRELPQKMLTTLLQLQNMVEALLELSRGQTGRLQLEIKEVAIPELLDQILDTARAQAEVKNIELRAEVDTDAPPLLTDRRPLSLILNNLVDNAIKYTQAGHVSLTLRYADGAHEFIVHDTGVGIPVEEQPRIFEPFERGAMARRSQTRGVGLGLALVRDTVATLGGEVSLHSEVDCGTTMTIRLPCSGPVTTDPPRDDS